MPSALVPLANLTLGSAAATVTFSSISGSYRDLMLIVGNLNTNTSVVYGYMRFNGDTATNYSYVNMAGDGSSATSGNGSNLNGCYIQPNSTFSTTSNAILTISIMDYSATDKHKTALIRSNNPGSFVSAIANRWASTAAITSLDIATTSATMWAAGSTFSLYGVSA